VSKVIPLDETDAVFTSHSSLHIHGTFHHAVDNTLGNVLLAIIKQDNGCKPLESHISKAS
jgi:hypothetical protein